jgi:hypothetical protein
LLNYYSSQAADEACPSRPRTGTAPSPADTGCPDPGDTSLSASTTASRHQAGSTPPHWLTYPVTLTTNVASAIKISGG